MKVDKHFGSGTSGLAVRGAAEAIGFRSFVVQIPAFVPTVLIMSVEPREDKYTQYAHTRTHTRTHTPRIHPGVCQVSAVCRSDMQGVSYSLSLSLSLSLSHSLSNSLSLSLSLSHTHTHTHTLTRAQPHIRRMHCQLLSDAYSLSHRHSH